MRKPISFFKKIIYRYIIGLQFRCGDCYMVTNETETHNNHITDIYEKMINIKI